MHNLVGAEAQAIVQALSTAGLGNRVKLTRAFAGFPSSAVAEIQADGGDSWHVQLIALGVPVITLHVRQVKGGVTMEEVK